jgi:hypothetical protein
MPAQLTPSTPGHKRHGDQIRKLVLKSFVNRDWSQPNAARVPLRFLQHTLALALCDPIHHQQFGSLQSAPLHSESTTAMCTFVAATFAAMPRATVWESLVHWVEALMSDGISGRAQLSTLTLCVEAVADALGPVRPADAPPGPTPGLSIMSRTTADLQAVEERLLEVLVALAALTTKEFGVHFKTALLCKLLQLARRLCPVGHARLGLVTAMLQLLPPGCMADADAHTSLRSQVADWLTPPSKLADPTRERTPAVRDPRPV